MLGHQGLELPGDDPVHQADADRERGIVEREEHVPEAQQVAARLVGIALGCLRLERLALALQAQPIGLQRLDGVLYVLHGLLDDIFRRPAVALQTDVVFLGLPGLTGTRAGCVLDAFLIAALGPPHRDCVSEHVRGVQERTAAARRNEMNVELVHVVAVVVVPVAGDHGPHVRAALAGNRRDLEEVLLLVLALQVGQHPGGLGEADDEVVVGRHALGHRLEIVDLRAVEVLGELDVRAPDPPVVGQVKRPVAAVLLTLPAADLVALGVGELVARGAEQAVEGGEPIIPVVVTRDGEQLAGRVVRIEGPVEGLDQALPVILARRLRIALVAAEDQHVAVPEPAGTADLQAVLGEQIRHRIGILEAVAHVGDVVDPVGTALVGHDAFVGVGGVRIAVVVAPAQLVVAGRIRDRLHQALVGVLAEHGRDQCAYADARQQPRVVPRHHLGQAPHAQLAKRTEFHPLPPVASLAWARGRRPNCLAPG